QDAFIGVARQLISALSADVQGGKPVRHAALCGQLRGAYRRSCGQAAGDGASSDCPCSLQYFSAIHKPMLLSGGNGNTDYLSPASNSSMLQCGLRPRASCNSFQLMCARPVSTSTMVMQSGTGQTSAQRLQPTHSSSRTWGTCFSATPWRRSPCGRSSTRMHWCAPSSQAI